MIMKKLTSLIASFFLFVNIASAAIHPVSRITLSDGAITTPKLGDGSVTSSKLHAEALHGFNALSVEAGASGNVGIGTTDRPIRKGDSANRVNGSRSNVYEKKKRRD